VSFFSAPVADPTALTDLMFRLNDYNGDTIITKYELLYVSWHNS
jgi:hypothetical protein